MQKRLLNSYDVRHSSLETCAPWLDLRDATAEVSSEEPEYPIENALCPSTDETEGWRAREPGSQVVRVLFDTPRRLSRIHLRFEEHVLSRSQEFTLAWRGEDGVAHEIVRQQWNFSPEGSRVEDEDFRVNVERAKVVELTIDPDRGSGTARATLQRLRLA